MADFITIEKWRDQLARMVRTGAIRKGLEVAAASLAAHGWTKSTEFASVTPGRPIGLGIKHGNLVRSLAGTVETGPRSVDVVLSSGGKSGFGSVPYARRHEEGTHGMPARPFLQPALVHISRKADRVISNEIARVLEGEK